MVRIVAWVLFASLFTQAQTTTDIARWKVEAERGEPKAQFWLGASYLRGTGVERDYEQSLAWLTKSAKQGNADALNLLGQMYENGEGVRQDYSQAAKWYRVACERRPDYGGAGQGCNNLANLYVLGSGVEKDKVQAYKYFKLARNTSTLATLKPCMTDAEIAKAENETARWIEAHPDR
jgi:TPR repeat protein